MSSKTIPNSMKRLRACIECKLVKTEGQFLADMCDNCQRKFESIEDVQEYTTANFNGIISMMDPKNSWVAKWQNLTIHMPGVYAVDVNDE